jgi:hypothetical protein
MSDAPKIPAPLLALENGCGVVAAWMALRRFRRRVAWKTVAKLCDHRKATGTFAIAIAVTLKKCGLSVTFCTDEDPDKKPREVAGYREAKKLGIEVRPALSIRALRTLAKNRLVIVLFDAENGDGHFSPVASVSKSSISFTYGTEPTLSLGVFRARWRGPGVCRQAIVVG